MALLAIPNLVAGAWAIIAPRSWYDDFPGWAPRLVAAIPPFNEHLATDAGAGLLATGIAAAIGAWWPRRPVVVATMATYVAFALPHAVYHLTHPSALLTSREDAVNAATLIVAAVAALIVLTRAALGQAMVTEAGQR